MEAGLKGQARVMIENVQPQVDGGRYPAKRAVGERVEVSADIFADGHDHIRAEILYRKKNEQAWRSVEMKAVGNDAWKGSFVVAEQTPYVFTVQAWIDHFETWFDGFKKKANAKLDVKLELQEGAAILRTLAKGKNKDLLKISEKLADTSTYNESIRFVVSDDFESLVHQYPLRIVESQFAGECSIQVEPAKALFSSWYELFPRSTSLDGKHGTFNDVVKLLPRIASMGFDVLYMPPIHPIGKINRKGKNNSVRSAAGEPGSPWAIGSEEGGHKAVHPALGSLSDFKSLITEAKKRGIDVALDLAYQCAPDHPYVKEHPEWFKQRPDGSIQYAENPPKKYQDIYPFDFECRDWKLLWDELLSVILFWVENGIRVFRVDNPHTKPLPFWEWAIAETHKLHPDIIFLSEAFTRPKIMNALAKAGFTQSYTYFTWRVSKEEIVAYMTELVHGPSRNYFRPNFWPTTPDILPFHLQHKDENSFIIRLALAATLSSNYGIYGPAFEYCDNKPIEGKEEFADSEKYEIKKYDWKRTNRLTDIISIINKVRKEHKALQSTWNVHFCEIQNPNLIGFLKVTDDRSDCMLVVVNLDPQQAHSGYLQLPKTMLKLKDKINVKLHDVMTNERYTWTQEWNYIDLNPHKIPFHLFELTVHESHM
ncbi:MAG: alpha-1,4-glucan--maltose-1-phosphate maltosyltransferase [Cyclobacteriaceae bacterium]